MRLIDADELMEHVWIDKLDSRELIAKMIDNALTVKEISTKIPINVFEQLISQEPKTGHWEWVQYDYNPKLGNWHCSECRCIVVECVDKEEKGGIPLYKYCPQCGAKMQEAEIEG